MDFRTLIDRNTPLSAVFPDYIAPRLQKPVPTEQAKPTKQQQDDESTTQKVRFFFILAGLGVAALLLATVGWTPGGFIAAGWWLAFVFAPKRVTVSINAYVVWMLSHLPGAGILAGLTVVFFVGSLLYGSVTGRHIDPAMILLALLCGVLFLLAVVGGVLNLIFGTVVAEDSVAEPVELTPADRVRAKIADILMDYYAPASTFSRPTLLRASFFPTPEAYEEALSDYEDELRQERLATVYSYVVDVQDVEGDEAGVVLLHLRVKDNRNNLIKLTETINDQLDAHGTRVIDSDGGGGTVVFLINTAPVASLLEQLTPPVDADEFFAANPIEDSSVTPVGFSPRLGVFNLPLHHTVCAGRTGSGKGSAFQTLIVQWMPLIAAGTRRLWVVDPKPAEALPYLDVHNRPSTSVLHRVATEEADIAALIFDFHDEMLQQKSTRVGIGRSNPETVEYPGNVLLIDEAGSMIDDKAFMSMKNSDGVTMETALNNIGLKGRSLNFFLFLFTQELTGQAIFRLSKNLPVKLVGFVGPNELETARGLGVKEADLTLHKHDIIFPLPPSSKANGYRYSGIFNSVDAENTFSAFRLPFVSEELIEAKVREFGLDAPNLAALPTLELANVTDSRGSSKKMIRKVETPPTRDEEPEAKEAYIASLLAQLEDDDD